MTGHNNDSCPVAQGSTKPALTKKQATTTPGVVPKEHLETITKILEEIVGAKMDPKKSAKKPPAPLRILAPKKYDGKAINLKNFQRSFKNYAKLCMADDETIKTALGTYLDDSAARWYEQLGDKTHMSLEDIFKKMKERFCPLQKIQTTHQEVMQMKMGPNEDIEDFIKPKTKASS
jgi:hypothetical protein